MTLSRLDDGELGGTHATSLRDKFRAMGMIVSLALAAAQWLEYAL